MRNYLILVLAIAVIAISCEDRSALEVNSLDLANCAADSLRCMQLPPADEPCSAYFESWFYNRDTGACTQIGYSGCSEKGFGTKEECELCNCQSSETNPGE